MRRLFRDASDDRLVLAWSCDACGEDQVTTTDSPPFRWRVLESYRRSLDLCPECAATYLSDKPGKED